MSMSGSYHKAIANWDHEQDVASDGSKSSDQSVHIKSGSGESCVSLIHNTSESSISSNHLNGGAISSSTTRSNSSSSGSVSSDDSIRGIASSISYRSLHTNESSSLASNIAYQGLIHDEYDSGYEADDEDEGNEHDEEDEEVLNIVASVFEAWVFDI